VRTIIPIGFAVLTAILAAPASAGPLEQGEAAWNRGEYAAALELLRPLADRGVAAAQATLGIMYDNGQGVPTDHAVAVVWFRKAANQGHAHAEYDLGLKYSQGQGVSHDDAVAVSWFQRAADHGDPEAMFRLGEAYELGRGVQMDYVLAYAWYGRAVAHFPATWTVSRDRAVARRDAIVAKLTSTQLDEARSLTREWAPK